MTMKVYRYRQDGTSTATYSRQQAHDSSLQEIRKKREMWCQLEDVEALLRNQTEYSSGNQRVDFEIEASQQNCPDNIEP